MPETELKVTLIACTPEPEKTCALAARTCYSALDTEALRQRVEEKEQRDFLRGVVASGHLSVLEHASFTFCAEGVSRSLLAQITRHRIASFSVQSQRYVDKSGFDYILPPEIAAIPEAKEEFERAMEEDAQHYCRLREILAKKHFDEMTAAGTDEKEAKKAAEKKANEDARFVLPNACDTRIIMTMNVRSLHNFFALRCCNRAQWEIRALATEMLRLCRAQSPLLFGGAGPGCLGGPCPEGGYCCGKTAEVREKFRSL